MKLLYCVVGVLFFVALAACGATSDSSDGSATDRSSADKKEKEQAAEERRTAILTARYQSCSSLSRQLDTRLNDLNSKLAVGLPFAEYSRAVGEIRVSYDRMFKRMGKATMGQQTCLLKVLVPLEASMNTYVAAYNDWNDCMGDYNCTMEGEKLTAMQAKWSKATRQLSRADRALANMKPAA